MEEAARASGVAIAVGVVLLSFIAWFARWLQDRRFVGGNDREPGSAPLPPGSMGWPLIGEMLDFLWCFRFSGRPDDFIAKRKARYGETGIYRSHLFGYPVIVTSSPDWNKHVLGTWTEEGIFSSGWPSSQLLGNSVANIDGAVHKRLRKHLMQAFSSPRSLDSHLSTAQPIFISTLEDWVSKKKIVAYDETKIMTFHNICDILVSFKSAALLDTMEPLYRGLMAGMRSMAVNIPGTAFHHALKCKKKLYGILSDELRKRNEQKVQKHDLMQILIDSIDDHGNKLSEAEIVDNILSLILGAHESTSSVMTWGLYYLAKFPEVLEKLKEETSSIRRGKASDDLLTKEDIKNMKYTSKVTDELLRLANIPPFIFRRVVKDEVLNGYKLPKNWKVLVWIRSIHIDPKYYGDPLAFNPDRWDDFKPKPGVYSVFGGGPRYCPGNNFARLQVMMFLHHVCLNYRWQLLNPEAGTEFHPHPRLKDGAEMLFGRA